MRIVFVIIFSLFLFIGYSQNLSDDRIVNWSDAGLRSVPDTEQWTLLNILDFGGSGDSITDNSSALSGAILALNDSPGIIFFPEGKYLFQSSIVLESNMILRGEGSDKTEIIINFGGEVNHGIILSKSQSGNYVEVISGNTKGSDYLKLTSTSGISNTDFADLRQDNGIWDTKPASWATAVVGQILHLDRINVDTIFLKQPLRLDYDTSLNLRIRPIEVISNVGLECLKIRRKDEPATAAYNIYMSHAYNCWVRGVESSYSGGSHVYITESSNIWVEGSYFHHAFKYDGVGTNGYGVTLNHRTGECLIENNVFRFLRHAMMVKTGANGNVFAYNYSIEPNRTEQGSFLSGDISLHGHYAFANLFEGNIVQNIIIDHFWGPSGPYNTFFRNRAELLGFVMTEDAIYNTKTQNIIGAEIINPAATFGNYTLTGTDHYEYANDVKGVIIPSGTTNLTLISLYLQQQPEYWDQQLSWPGIGIPNAVNSVSIPAKDRYLSGGLVTTCPEGITSIGELDFPIEDLIIDLYPNPVRTNLFIRLNEVGMGLVQVRLLDLLGTEHLKIEWDTSFGPDLKLNLADRNSGLYFISFVFENGKQISRKIILQ